MASFYHLDAEHELVLFRSPGRFTEREFISLLRGAYDDPRHSPQFNHIWDARSVEELVVDVDIISMYRDVLDEYEGKIPRGKIAIVAVRTLIRTFASMLSEVGTKHPATFRIFDDMTSAAEWAEVPASAIPDVSDDGWMEV